MRALSHIVVATDFSPGASAAVQRAAQLAVVHGATLCLLHAYDVGPWHGLKGLFDAKGLAVDPAPDVRMRQRLDELSIALSRRSELAVASEFGVGAAHTVIGDYARAHPEALVVIGSRCDPAMVGLGSTALKVVRSPACPVLVVRTDGIRPYDKVLSAVDMRAGSVRAATVAVGLFPKAHHHLLCALPPELEPAWLMAGLQPAQIAALLESMQRDANSQLQELAQRLRQDTQHQVTFDIASDAPSRAILVAAASLPADCVVVGHDEQNPSDHGGLGSMAQHVVQFTTCDVLVVP